MNEAVRIPFYIKVSIVVIGGYFFIRILYVAQDIIIPVLYALILAVAISPVVNFLVSKNVNRTLSILMVMMLALGIAVGLVILTLSQASLLIDAWPQLSIKCQDILKISVSKMSEFFNISIPNINIYISQEKLKLISGSGAVIGNTLYNMGSVLSAAVLTPVYIVMILFYQHRLLDFMHQLFGSRNNDNVTKVLSQTKGIVQGYLGGLFIEFAILSALNTVGLLVLGIEYAVLLGVIGGLLNIIPYLGGILGVVIFMVAALLTKPPIFVLYVILLYTIIQFVDNNYIVPKIVGAKVKLNALVSVFGVVSGAAIWGVPGMFLAIPLIAIIKLMSDRIEALKPLGFLLGDEDVVVLKTKFHSTMKELLGNLKSKQK